jgi:hypothetical protein
MELGQTEGQINRLKMLKRAMYGRANAALICKGLDDVGVVRHNHPSRERFMKSMGL